MGTATFNNIVPLHAAVQNYAWGLTPESGSLVARLHSLNTGRAIDDTLPYAELWMGVHKSGPAVVAGEERTTLSELLASEGIPDIPYLFKVLSVAKPLSIQAHPHKALAEQLHARNPKAYKDDNHKPEMCVALTDFEGMCNFRSVAEIHALLKRFGDFANLCGGKPIINDIESAAAADGEQKKKVLKQLFANLMNSDSERIQNALDSTLNIVRTSTAQPRLDADILFERLCNFYPGDVGCFAAYLLNYIKISPGDAFFMAANEPHAYLQGQCMEIMANSDNVVRAGLTPKFKDVTTLVDMLTYSEGPPVIMKGVQADACTTIYQPPASEFQLSRCVVSAGNMHMFPPAVDSGIVLCIAGSGWITLTKNDDGSDEPSKAKLPMCPGKIYYVPKNCAFTAMADESAVATQPSPDLYFFRAGVNESS